jgi:ribosome-associated protein
LTNIIEKILLKLEDDKALNIVRINLKGKSDVADFLVIATGTSSRHVSSISVHLIDEFKKLGVIGIKPEGLTRGDWVLIDGGDIIVHIFRDEVRQFYNLEKLWDSSVNQNNKSF